MFTMSNILDTLRFDEAGFFLKEFHMHRTFEAYQLLQKDISFETVADAYDTIERQLLQNFSHPLKVRLIFDKDIFSYKIQTDVLDELKVPLRLQVLENALDTPSFGSSFKWEDRSIWNSLLLTKNPVADDIIVINKNGYVRETSRFNIFVYSEKEKMVFTPTLTSGCVNGVYRRFVLEKGKIDLPGIGLKHVLEIDFTAADILKMKIFLANSVRKILPAELI